VPRESQDAVDLVVKRDRLVMLDSPVPPVDPDLLGLKDPKVELGLLEVLEKRVQRERPVLWELKELLVNLDLPGLLDQWVLPVIVVMKENRDQLGLLVTQEIKATKVFPVSLDCAVREENLDRKEKVELRVPKGLKDLLALWDLKDNKDRRAFPVQEEILDPRVFQESPEMLELKVVRVTRGHRALPALPVLKDLKAVWA